MKLLILSEHKSLGENKQILAILLHLPTAKRLCLRQYEQLDGCPIESGDGDTAMQARFHHNVAAPVRLVERASSHLKGMVGGSIQCEFCGHPFWSKEDIAGLIVNIQRRQELGRGVFEKDAMARREKIVRAH